MFSKAIILKACVVFIILCMTVFFVFTPAYIDKSTNRLHQSVLPHVTEKAKALHATLFIGDWHSDSLMWKRDLSDKHDYSHVDIPRLQQGNVALQMFTTVTKSPDGINYQQNSAEAADNITKLALVNRWPVKTWNSLTERALYQAYKAHQLAKDNPNDVELITSQSDLKQFQEARLQNNSLVGVLLGTEGSHALDGNLENIQRLFNNGFRMMSLQHFFDNKLGGSLHGESGKGLTEFGRQAIKKMLELGVMIDVSHSSVQVVKDTLAISSKPLLISHTGLAGHCPSARNIPDQLMQQIAQRGGLVAIGYWDGAVCDASVSEIAKAIKYGITLLGSEHIALGSDFDGATSVPFDAADMVYLTQALMDQGLTEKQIRQVMGENMLLYLQAHLPE